MIQTTMALLIILLFPVVGAYMYSVWKFYNIVTAEKPGWIQKRGPISFLYDGMPRIGDPNVSMALIRTAYSKRIHELTTPMAVVYAYWIRALLPISLGLFVSFITLARTMPT